MHLSHKGTFDLNNYDKHKKIFYTENTKYYEIINQKTGQKNIAKFIKIYINDCSRIRIFDLYREVYISSRLNHPSFLKFIGFSSHDFKSKPKPIIVFDHILHFSLTTLLKLKNANYYNKNIIEASNEIDKESCSKKLTFTKKLIILYGIASGMSYLHTNNIIHQNLDPSCIFFDDNFLPKISRLDMVKSLDPIFPFDEPRNVDRYYKYGKANDVYSFSLLMYELMFEKTIIVNQRENLPLLDHSIPECYENLIVKCWSKNPEERPTFDEIVEELRNNRDFITKDVNEEEYRNYIKFIDDSEISFNSENKITEMDEIYKMRSNEIKRTNFDVKYRGPLDPDPVLDIQKYYLQRNIEINVAVEKETNIEFCIYLCSREIDKFFRYEIINFARCINIWSQLNHPAIAKFVGYSPVDFYNEPKPVFITEYYDDISDYNTDDTLKLIIFYGVAAGMAYLQEHNILHRNLKRDSIGLNHYKLPVITGFDIAKEMNFDSVEPNETIKGAPVYIAPEVYLNKGYNKKSDVYSYSLILYQLLTNEQPYKDFYSPKEIKEKICNINIRPAFNKPILKCYQDLIEKCWSSNPSDRPTFKEIMTELKTNPEFITDTVDKERFFEYVAYLDDFPVTFEPNRRVEQFDDILNNRLNSFREIKTTLHSCQMTKTEKHNLIIDDDLYLNTNDFCCGNSEQSGYFYDIDLVKHKKLKYDAIMRFMKGEPLYLYKHEVINLSRELNILLQLNHPSILKFYGYGLNNEDEISFYVEYSQIGSLGKIIQLERSKSQINSSSNELDKEEDVKCKDVDSKDDDKDENDKDENDKDENDKDKNENDENENDENKNKNDNDENDENEDDENDENEDDENDENEDDENDENENDKDENEDDENDENENDKDENENNNDENEDDEDENANDKNENENDENENENDEDENDQNGDENEGENENNEEEEEEEVEENNDSSEDEVSNVPKENDVSVNLDNTSIFIIIYGIAAGMEYLHSHNILHRDLKPNNVYISNSIYPKISGFNIAKEMKNNLIEPNEKIKGTPVYIAPEVYLNKGYSKKSDVYSYSLILYELLTNEQPYKDFYSPKEIKEKICDENYRPSFNKPILKCYQDLIEKCWSSDPSDRPTFKEIMTELKTNPEFTKNVDKEKLQEYFDFLDESPKTFESSQKIPDLDEFIKRKLYLFKEYNSKINFRSVLDTETNNVSTIFDYCDINDFDILKTIERNDIYKLFTVQDKKTKEIYIAKKIYEFVDSSDAFKKINLSNEINNNIKLNHPFFLKFLKYSPYDYNNNPNPILMFENTVNRNLERMIKVGRKNKSSSFFNDTKKLIILYGIASAMSYLHSINIIHLRLRPSNIFLDGFLFPKITGFDISRPLSENLIVSLSELNELAEFYQEESIYDSPELIKCYMFSSACDVYSFGVIAYQLVANDDPIEDNDGLVDINRSAFNDLIPYCYKNLIQKCWHPDPKERPTFEEIVHNMKTDNEFITKRIDKEEFINFVQYIDEIQSHYTNNINIHELNDFIQTRNQRFRKVKINYHKYVDINRLNLSVNLGSIDLNKYSVIKEIGQGSFSKVYTVLNKENNTVYAAKISFFEIDECPDDIIINLSREIDILSTSKYASVIKFVGYNAKNFEGIPKPVIITEYIVNKTLADILEDERKGLANPNWDNTKKLINIYGIAAAMEYFASRNIIHRDLKPENILIDEYLYPKIADFGLSKNIYDHQSKKKEKASGFKGTPKYSAPEVLSDYNYSEFSDVYSFAMVVYEIVTGNKPFGDVNNYFQFLAVIDKKYRPKIDSRVPFIYKRIIEKCWREDSSRRPSFSKIINILENDLNFIALNIDKDEFSDYVEYVKKYYQNEYNEEKAINAKKVVVESKEEAKNEETNDFFLNLNRFERKNIIYKGDIFKYYKIIDKETQDVFAAYLSKYIVNEIAKEEIEKLSVDLKVITELNHPSLLKFIGFSLNNFKNQRKPVVVTEFSSNGSLEQFLSLEKRNIKIDVWDLTKKLIIIYGIAAGMAYMHSHNIIHRCLMPSNIYLDDVLLPKIGDFGLLARFYDPNVMVRQSLSGDKGTPIYTAPEVLESNTYSKSSDVYSFAFIVYEIFMNEKPFCEIVNKNKLFDLIVNKGERPLIKKNIPKGFRKLIKICWSQIPDERPDFEEIVNYLKNDLELVSEEINKDDYQKYIKFIDSHTSNMAKINEKSITTSNKFLNKTKIDELNIISENSDVIDLSPKRTENKNKKQKNKEQHASINELIASRNSTNLMNFLNSNCDNETISSVFDQCYQESRSFYLDLCKEGISLNNAVSHHKYAISIEHEPSEICKHLQESIKLGFNLSYFSLSRLYYEVYKDDKKAFNAAEEGFKNEEKYSTCLLGYFISHGIGTEKNFHKGISLILSSKAFDYQSNFATDIGIYYLQIDNKEEAFKWFEKAFNIKQTKATINNYGICFIKGIGVDKNIEKAKEVFKLGVNKKDANSMYHLALILEETDPKESLRLLKLAADQGHPKSQFNYAKLLQEKDPNLSLKYFIKAANEGENIESQEFLAIKYANENDTENTLKYIHMLIKEGCFRVPLNYAVTLYKNKMFKQAFYIFSILYEYNHPIAMYFVGVMKYKGQGCLKDKNESYQILKSLSDKGIDNASEFLENFDF